MTWARTATLCVLVLPFACPVARADEPKPRLELKDNETRGGLRLAFSADGKLLAVFGSVDMLTIWNTTTGKRTAGFKVKSGVPKQVAFAPDGKSVCTLASDDRGLQQFDLTGKLLSSYMPKDGFIDGIAFDVTGRVLVSARHGKRVWVRDVGAEKDIFEASHPQEVATAHISPDGKTVLAPDLTLGARLWDVKSGKLIATCPSPGLTGPREAFSPDGKLFGWGGAEKTGGVVWDAATGKEICSLPGPGGTVYAYAVAFDPSGKTFLTGSTDGKVRVWDVKTKRCFATLPAQVGTIFDVVVSPDGRTLAEVGTDAVRLWDMPVAK